MRARLLLLLACFTAILTSLPATVVKVAAGSYHSALVDSDGTLRMVGANAYGQLGDGTTTDRLVPVSVATDVIEVAAGRYHTLFLKADRTLWGMGSSSDGELGFNDSMSRHSPVQLATGVVKVAAIASATCYVTEDGKLWGMGWNVAGRFGLGSESVYQSIRVPTLLATGVADVVLGESQMFFITRDGVLWAAGDNGSGQLGDGTLTSRPTFVQVMSEVDSVAAGQWHALVLRRDGSVWSCGLNYNGQLGDGTTAVRLGFNRIATGVTDVWAGSSTSYYRDTTGALWQFGNRREGAGGQDLQPVKVLAGVSSVSTVRGQDFLVGSDGALWVRGTNYYGQLALGTKTAVATEWLPLQMASQGSFVAPAAPAQLSASVDVAGGVVLSWPAVVGATGYEIWSAPTNDSASAVLTLGHLSSPVAFHADAEWGATRYYWVRATTPAGASPLTGGVAGKALAGESVQITTQPASVSMIVGGSVTLHVAASGTQPIRYRWRKNGALLADQNFPTLKLSGVQSSDAGTYTVEVSNGGGTVTSQEAVLSVVPLQGVLQAWASGGHSLFLRTDGSLWGMGQGMSGELGTGGTSSALPTLIATDVVGAAAGRSRTFFITSDGTLYACGANAFGELGLGEASMSSLPTPVATEVAAVAAGWSSSFFIKKDGTLWAMGYGEFGELGYGDIRSSRVPVQVGTDAIAVVAGQRHTVYLKSDGTLWAAGDGAAGQLGDGTFTRRNTWVNLAHSVTAVAAGDFHTLFLRTDSTLWATGWNSAGQLGGGNYTDAGSMRYVIDSMIQVSAGGNSSLFLRNNGALWAMGLNYGVYGNGQNAYFNSAVQVQDGPFSAIAVGSSHALFVRTDGSLWSSGNNYAGQLGNGTTTSTLSPVQVATGPLVAPSAPRNPRASRAGDGFVRVAWDAPLGWQRFEIWRGPTASISDATLIAPNVALPTYQDRTASANASYHYWIKSANPAGTSAASAGVSVVVDPPVITTQPASQTVEAGSVVSLTVAATGAGPLTYQWRKHDVAIEGATTASLGFASATVDDAGEYQVIVRNAGGATTSQTAVLTVERRPQAITFVPPSDQAFSTSLVDLVASASSGLPVSFVLLSGPAQLDGARLTLTGAGVVSLRASQAGDATYAAAANLDRSFVVRETIDSWRRGQFSESEQLDPAISGPDADPDRDGMPNLVEYALGLDPKNASTSNAPAVGLSSGNWTFTYTRPADRTDVTYAVEWSTTLTEWSRSGVTLTRVSSADGRETWSANYPAASAANCYFRLVVTR